jgi:CDP-glucose 4,6-dehydratase
VDRREPALEDVVTVHPGIDPNFWNGRRVLLTGHTGFKGAWTAIWLARLGAEVHGYALAPDTEPSLWQEAGSGLLASETVGDLADRRAIAATVARARPEVVLHLAAQALVRRSYAEPVETIGTNVMGTAHLLEALRDVEGLRAVLAITTDKVYANADTGRDFVEDDPLGGHDPYSASKAAAELIVRSYAHSFFDRSGVPLATARAGNVIGGGDWSADRLVPDVWRAARAGRKLMLRHPDATRPWQHVLEPVRGYLIYAQALAARPDLPRALNFGPEPGRPLTVAQVAEAVGAALGAGQAWERDTGDHPAEMKLLSLDPSLARDAIGWRPLLTDDQGVAWTARWYSDHAKGAAARTLCETQISEYEALQ